MSLNYKEGGNNLSGNSQIIKFYNDDLSESDDIYQDNSNSENSSFLTKLASTSADDQIEVLQWMQHEFRQKKEILSDCVLLNLLHLLKSENEIVLFNLSKVIAWSISFQSPNIDFLINHGLLEYIFNFFPGHNTIQYCYHLTAHSALARQKLIQNGYLDALLQLANMDTLHEFSTQLISLTNLPFDDIDPNIMSKIFGLFQHLLMLFNEDQEFECSDTIITAFHALIKSNKFFLQAFMEANIIEYFIHSECQDQDYTSRFLKMVIFICNENEKYAQKFANNEMIKLIDHYIIDEEQIISPLAIKLLTLLVFYCPEITDEVYKSKIPMKIIDMFSDDLSTGGNNIEILSFAVVMMALSSPRVYSKLKKNGYYDLIAQNAWLIDNIYEKWVLRVLCRGFVTGNQNINNELRAYLMSNEELMRWLQDLGRSTSKDIRESSDYLLKKIVFGI